MEPRVTEVTASFPVKYCSPWILALGGSSVRIPAGVEGTDRFRCRSVGTLAQEDILNSSEWLLPKIYAVINTGLGSGSNSCFTRRVWAACL